MLVIPIGQIAFSQNVISGTVTDSNGQPLPGATVLIQNTTRGTNTDFDGLFTLEASEGEVLEISFIVLGFSNSLHAK